MINWIVYRHQFYSGRVFEGLMASHIVRIYPVPLSIKIIPKIRFDIRITEDGEEVTPGYDVDGYGIQMNQL